MQSDEGQLAGRYLSKVSNQLPLCISHVTTINRNDKLRCQGLANGLGTSIYQLKCRYARNMMTIYKWCARAF